jgi:Telomere resolvase
MSKQLQEQIDKLFTATKDLASFDEIKPCCDEFNEWANEAYERETLGTLLSRHGFYKKFNSLKLEQGKNAESVPKYDGEGNIKSYALKHYAILLCGLTKEEWAERNETSRVTDRLMSTDGDGLKGQEAEPTSYTEVTGKLLESSNPHELAVGLIAATGRRPHEILARAKFTAIEGEEYKLNFEGQGKKRGEIPVVKISTLYPASYLIKCLSKLRQDASCKSLLAEVRKEFPSDLAAQNRTIENRRGNSLRRVVQEFFGGREDKEPLLNFRLDQDQNDCKALRAAYAALVTERDCPGSVGAKLYFYALMLGHITPDEKLTDNDLRNLSTTVGYADYYVTKPVPFPQGTVKEKAEKTMMVRAFAKDFHRIKDLQSKWELPNQQGVVSQLVKKSSENEELKRQLMEAQAQISDLHKQLEQTTMNHQEQAAPMNPQELPQKDLLRAMIAEILAEQQALPQPQQVIATPTPTATPTATPTTARKPRVENWEAIPSEELKKLRGEGAVDEKIRRAFAAIADFNDAQPGNQTRWAVTNQSLRQVSGCNGLSIKAWMERYQISVNDHNAKYSLSQFDNKGKGDITQVVRW